MTLLLATWPFAASLAAAVAIGGLRAGRRRHALNEAVHELRRPLQALALVGPTATPTPPADLEPSLRMAAAALERLEREINGSTPVGAGRERFAARPLLAEAARRWRAPVARRGGCLELSWEGPGGEIDGNREEIERALDNLVANAIEHGGPRILLAGRVGPGSLCIAVTDRPGEMAAPASPGRSGACAVPSPGRRDGLLAVLSGRRRRGHGLRLVRRVAAAHGGRFELRRGAAQTEARLELRLGDPEGAP